MIHPDTDPRTYPHTHDDHNRLTFGCPSCTVRVRLDQERSRWREAPLCRVTFIAAMVGHHEWSADLRVPVGATERHVCIWYGDLIAGELAMRYPDISHDLGDRLVESTYCRIGPLVEDMQAEPAPTYDIPLLEIPTTEVAQHG